MARERDRGYWLAPPFHGPYISGRRALSIGIKRCPQCEEWKQIDGGDFKGGFAWAGHYPSGKRRRDGFCRQCRRLDSRRQYYAHLEERKVRSAESYQRRRSDPRKKARIREQERERQRRYREQHPEREHDRQKRYREKVMADPARRQAKRDQRNRWYANGGAQIIAASRARRRMRKAFAGLILAALKVELARREEIARARREEQREIRRVWVLRRREAWERGEVGDAEPVWRDDELRRLPTGPLVAWMKRQGWTADGLAEQSGVNARALRRYTSGESLTLSIEVIDAIVTHTDALLFEIYEPGRFPGVYEVPDAEPASNPQLEAAV